MRDNSYLHFRQAKYIADLLESTKMIGAKPLACPTTSGIKFSVQQRTLLTDPTEYKLVVGALQYCIVSKLDISYAVNQLCQFMHSPLDVHWVAIKRVLLYLKGTIDFGLRYSSNDIVLNAYCDSDWTGNPDDRKNTNGCGIFFGLNLISWTAKKQNIVSHSSTEAEYQSMALATAKMYWIQMTYILL